MKKYKVLALNENAVRAMGDVAEGDIMIITEPDLKEAFHSPEFTGVPIAPTADPGTNTDQLATTGFVHEAVSNKVELVGGKIPEGVLPSYVDDVIDGYYYESAFYTDSNHEYEIVPEEGKIYVDVVSNKTYRWSGSVYVQVGGEEMPVPVDPAAATASDEGKPADAYKTKLALATYQKKLTPGQGISIDDSANISIPEGGVDGSMLANNAVNGAKIANLSVSTGKLTNKAVSTAKIADGAVTADKIDPNALSGYATKDDLPTKVSDLENDAGYITDETEFIEWKSGASIAAGNGSSAAGGTTSVAIGNRATAGQKAIAISSSDANNTTNASGAQSIAVGFYAKATANEAIAIGKQAQASAAGAVQIGYSANANATANSLRFRDTVVVNGDGKIPSANLDKEIPSVTAPSTAAADAGKAADAKATGDALAGKLDKSGGTVTGTLEVVDNSYGFTVKNTSGDYLQIRHDTVAGNFWYLNYSVNNVGSGSLRLPYDNIIPANVYSLASVFDESTTYALNSLCTDSQGVLYRCINQNGHTGAWVAADFAVATVEDVLKASDSDVVHKTGDETISGTKSFSYSGSGSYVIGEKNYNVEGAVKLHGIGGGGVRMYYGGYIRLDRPSSEGGKKAYVSASPTQNDRLVDGSNHPYIKSTDLATVATTGSYNDLTNKPTIPASFDRVVSQDGNSVAVMTDNGSVTVTKSGGYDGPIENWDDLKEAVGLPSAATPAEIREILELPQSATVHDAIETARDLSFTRVLLTQNALATPFSDAVTYGVGDYVTKDGRLYECKNSNVTGVWNGSNFKITSVAEIFEGIAAALDTVIAG